MSGMAKSLLAGAIAGALLMTAPVAFAGDQARGLFVGFSDDQKYCAVETIGVQDGSGFPYATIFIIDVAANDWAADPVSVVLKTTGDETASALDAHYAVLASAKNALARFGINPSLAGMSVAVGDPGRIQFKNGQDSYALVLTAAAAKESTDAMPLALMQLQLIHGSERRTLQKDSAVPKTRGNAYAYRISEVHVDGDALAVIIDYDRTGFEGPDTRQLVVTAKLN